MNSQEFMEDMKQLLRAEISGAVLHIDQRIDGLERRMDGVDQCIGGIENRIGGIENRIGSIEQHMLTKEDLEDTQIAIAEILTTGLESVDSKSQVDDHERRITRLEHHAA